MATLDEALRARLLSIPTLSAIGPRIYPALVPPGTALPYIVYSQVAYEPVKHHTDYTTLSRTTYQLDIYAGTYSQAHSLAETVRYALAVWRDVTATPAIMSVIIDQVWFEPEERADGSAEQDSRFIVQIDIWAAQPQPALA